METKRFAILTSGGDSPGMNCAIRAFTRTMIYKGHEVIGVEKGYTGLINKDYVKLKVHSVGNILQRGGTILQSSRSEDFRDPKFRELAANHLRSEGISGLVVIGGDGSFNGAYLLSKEQNISVIGVPGTIDNDISGTDYTIGHDTAVQTAMEAVDKIRDTAFSHDRVFLIEVMGRNSASLAQKVGLCSGAENVILPSEEVPYEKIVKKIKNGISRGKKGSILIVAEGPKEGRSYEIQKVLKDKYSLEGKVCILGHTQRGGSPIANDRILATKMGHLSALGLLDYKIPQATSFTAGKVQLVPLEQCLTKVMGFTSKHSDITKILSI